MISNEQLLMQIDKHLKHARNNGNEQSVRESLVAIKALCDVGLEVQIPSQAPIARSGQTTSTILPTQPLALKEEDANGESLFDF
ncbi:YwdI family protein [Psychrobacillus sp. INOP01]|uniref:YwdI family protein n=1 Tax=Psychrobacillus sp. INOP01 TaxID=2829187 RepID=UPI001BA57C67|nr:YwdI family protein [Psychrobacillus sp. INOP01]QUG40436.1 YwdI family protein [Psychrobacillus sp. INOP01]